jgi:dihydrofolate reductase
MDATWVSNCQLEMAEILRKGSTMRVVVINHVTLDGVMQSPGRPDEDTRGGFSHGGWASPGSDEATTQATGERMGKPGGGLLLGRRSYEDMLAHWNEQGGRFKDGLNAAPKYVASTSSATQLEWPNSTLLHGDIPAAVADLKQKSGGNLVIMGSGQLIRSLLPHGLIDEYLLMIHPLVLGSGRRLFDHDDHVAKLQLLDSTATATGVIVAAYRPAA